MVQKNLYFIIILIYISLPIRKISQIFITYIPLLWIAYLFFYPFIYWIFFLLITMNSIYRGLTACPLKKKQVYWDVIHIP